MTAQQALPYLFFQVWEHCDYKNYIRPAREFNHEVINELAKNTVSFSEIERYITTLFYETKFQENLVWDKHLGELIGFVDLGGININ